MARETFEGELTLAPDFYPPKGWIVVPKPHYPHWQVRFKRLPESLHGCHSHRIRVACTPDPFHNGLGVYATRAKVECLTEHPE